MEKTIERLELELNKQKALNYLIGEIIKYSTNIEPLDDSMEKTLDMLLGVLGLSAISIYFSESINSKTYCRNTQEGSVSNSCVFLESEKTFEPNQVYVYDTYSEMLLPLTDHKNNQEIGKIYLKSNNRDFFDSSILSFFEILSIQIPIIVANSLIFEKMQHASIKDILTNCYNRKHLTKSLEKIEKEKISVSLAFFDLDNFKFVNDTFGHSYGDRILLDISDIALSYSIRHNAEVFRYGGDEFIMIFYNCPLEKARVILEDFKSDITKGLSVSKELDISQTISIGLANYPETVDTVSELLDVADQALINGKSIQKNRIYIGKKEDLPENS